MKRAALIAKLSTFHQVYSTGMLSKEQLISSLNDGLARKTLRKLRPEEFGPEDADLQAFANEFNFLKAAKGAPGAPRGPRGDSYEKLARAQYLALDAALSVTDELSKVPYAITLSDGTVTNVAFMPYFRRVKANVASAPAPSPAGDAQTNV